MEKTILSLTMRNLMIFRQNRMYFTPAFPISFIATKLKEYMVNARYN